jgi:menaquinone-dependent protoporphyrinogen IX oxidase
MKRILVAYATESGSTVEVAQAVGEELAGEGVEVEVLPLDKVGSPAGYHAVVVGAPMIMGWHRSATTFLEKHRQALEHTPLALFATAMSLTSTGETAVDGVPLWLDETLAKPPSKPQRPTFRENYASTTRYASPMLRAAGANKPVSVAFFGGRLDYSRLKLLPRLFVMLAVQAEPGDRRNWQSIRSWADSLPQHFDFGSARNSSREGSRRLFNVRAHHAE